LCYVFLSHALFKEGEARRYLQDVKISKQILFTTMMLNKQQKIKKKENVFRRYMTARFIFAIKNQPGNGHNMMYRVSTQSGEKEVQPERNIKETL
jgi:hypothetical protein